MADLADPAEVKTTGRMDGFSLSGRLLISTFSIAIVAIVVMSSLAFVELRAMATRMIDGVMTSQLTTIGRDLEDRLSLLRAGVESLSRNPLVANALVDNVSRADYLRKFLSGVDTAEGFHVSLWVADFEGTPLEANGDVNLLPVQPAWVAGVIAGENPQAKIIPMKNDYLVVFAAPIIFANTGTAEGALIGAVRLSDWFEIKRVKDIIGENPFTDMVNLNSPTTAGDAIVNPGARALGAKTYLEKTMTLDANATGLADELSVRLSFRDEIIKEPLGDLLKSILLSAAAILFLTFLITVYVLRRQMARLNRLRAETGQLPTLRDQSVRFTVEGKDEIADLAGAFNRLVQDLKSAYGELEQQARQSLERSEDRFRAIIESSPEGIITLTETGVIETVNAAAEKMFAVQRHDVVGADINMLLTVEGAARFDPAAWQNDGLVPSALDVFGRSTNSRSFPIELTVLAINVDDGRRFVAMMRDISERREFEGRLHTARIAAESANHAKSEFLATMSHEIRTPMTGVMGISDILLAEALPDSVKARVEKIRSSSQALLNILNDILDISKLEAGRLEIETLSFDPKTVISQVVALYENAGNQSVSFEVRFSDDFPSVVKSDPTRFRQVIGNLVSNAKKFTNAGTIVVDAALEGSKAGGQNLKIVVTDTGIGMTDETMAKLFKDYVQADSSISRKFDGTGLGLAICKRLADAMNGDIGVESSPGEGSRFWFKVPYVAGDPRDIEKDRAINLPAAPQAALNILIAEDNEMNQMVLSAFLQALGHSYAIVGNGREAVDAYAAGRYDLIMMDIRMPEMSGPEATRLIRAMDGPKCEVPIIAVTADAMNDHIEDFKRAGMDLVVSKPINRDMLETAIAKVTNMDARSASRMTRESPANLDV